MRQYFKLFMRRSMIRYRHLRYLGFVCIVAIGALSVGILPVHAQTLPDSLQQAWQQTGLPQDALSFYVQEVGKAEPEFAIDADAPRNPASVMKVVTTWAALSGLGPEYQWRTAFMAEGGGVIEPRGTLSGPLYIKASGDPFFSETDLWQMLRELRLRGIKNISSVVVDKSIFGDVAIDPNAFDNAGDRPYNAAPDAMMVGLGAVRLLFHPDVQGKKWVPVIDPPLPGVRVEGGPEWAAGRCPGAPRVQTQVVPKGDGVTIQVSGKVAGSCDAFSVWRLALSQEAYFASVFKMLWRELGGTLARDIRFGKSPANAKPLVWHVSDSLSDLIRRINKQSNNVMARTLMLSIGAQLQGQGATAQSSAQATLRLLQSQGLDTTGWHIDNGSGLSRTGRLTARGLANLLDTAWHSPLMPEFLSSLAIAGVDGTLRRRMKDGAAKGRAHLKTGTLRDARALAGYVLSASGKRYVLVSLVNGQNAVAARRFEDAAVDWLAQQ